MLHGATEEKFHAKELVRVGLGSSSKYSGQFFRRAHLSLFRIGKRTEDMCIQFLTATTIGPGKSSKKEDRKFTVNLVL